MRDLAKSMEFDISRYQMGKEDKLSIGSETGASLGEAQSKASGDDNTTKRPSTQNSNDTYDSVVENIDNFLHVDK